MNKEILQVEKDIYDLAVEIEKLDKLATDAYKIHDFKTEDKYQEQINKKVDEKNILIKKLLDYYEYLGNKSTDVLEKYTDSQIYMGIIGKIAQVTQPFVREISLYKGKDDEKFTYVKLDATDGYTGKVQQTKIYWSKQTVRDMIDGLTRVFKEM